MIQNGRRAVGLGDVEMPEVLISMLIVLQIPFRLLLAQSYSFFIIFIDTLLFSETNFKICLVILCHSVRNLLSQDQTPRKSAPGRKRQNWQN